MSSYRSWPKVYVVTVPSPTGDLARAVASGTAWASCRGGGRSRPGSSRSRPAAGSRRRDEQRRGAAVLRSGPDGSSRVAGLTAHDLAELVHGGICGPSEPVGGRPYARRHAASDRSRAPGGALRGAVSTTSPSGDQPTAIAEITERIQGGEKDVVLLGATGTGKTATVAWVAEQAAAADPGDAAQQDPRRPVRQRAAPAVPRQRGRVLRLLLRLLPARGLRPADRHLHREGLLDQRGGRAAAALGDQLAAHPARRDRGLDGLLHLRPRHPAGVRRPDAPPPGRRGDDRDACCAGSSRSSTPATTCPSPAAPSGSAATPSRSSRSTRSTPCASSSSATRSSG